MKLSYDTATLEFSIPPGLSPYIIDPPIIQPISNPVLAVINALKSPIFDINIPVLRPGQTVAIAINDKTRPVPHDILIPQLLDFLQKIGVPPEQITFYISTGTHSPMPAEDFSKIVPVEFITKYQIVSHDCDSQKDMQYIGTTKHGTPVHVNKGYYNTDIKIVVGNIEPHHFMGFSGGVKSAAIGLTSRLTINSNHAHLIDANSKAGNLENNLCRIDVEEIGQMIGIDYALNVILNTNKEIVHVLWGKPVDVMEHGVNLSRDISSVMVPHLFDCVVASAGGYPKDINLYQAQKALTNAAFITKDGGDVYLLAGCREGAGNSSFENFLKDAPSPTKVMKRFGKMGFKVGPHKAYQIAKIAARVNIHLLSMLQPELAKKCMFTPFTIEDLDIVLSSFENTKLLAIMPHAVVTIPKL
jgi:nickel-dependent lactate racemase